MGSYQEKNIIQGVAIILGKGSNDMAEKKSLEYLNKLHSKIVRSAFAKNVTEQEMLALIEGKKALEEVQQYRTLGMTPAQVEEMQIEYCVKSTILEEYKKLGTVEELRVARDKQVAKKFIWKKDVHGVGRMTCPNCKEHYIRNPYKNSRHKHNEEIFPYCPWCGQKIESRCEDDNH